MENYPDLVQPGDLTGLPGAPFSVEAVAAAATAVRNAAGWHIAPVVTETLTLDSDGSPLLLVPTGRMGDITEVRDVSGTSPRVVEGWRASRRLNILELRKGWPKGFGVIEVDLSHGFFECPADLLPVIADRAQRRVRQQTSGPFSITFATDSDEGSPHAAALAAYRLPKRP